MFYALKQTGVILYCKGFGYVGNGKKSFRRVNIAQIYQKRNRQIDNRVTLLICRNHL